MTSDDPLPQIPIALQDIETDDRLVLHGALADARTRRIGVLFLHGLGSNLFKTRHLWMRIAARGKRSGIGVLALNTRGHDIAARYRIQRRTRKAYRMGGAGLERFTESLHDIRAGIRHLKRAGYQKIVLLGHSTGANKAVYYAGKTQDRRLRGVILAGPARDLTMVSWDAKHRKKLERVKAYAKRHGNDSPLPQKLSDGGIFSAQRYLSLFQPGTPEDVFPFGEPAARWTRLGQVRAPLYVVFGEDDPYIAEPGPEQALALMNEKAKRAASVAGDVLSGQGHSFHEGPDAFAESTLRWIRTTVL